MLGCKVEKSGEKWRRFPLETFGAYGASGAFGTHRVLGLATLAMNCWPKAPGGGGGGGGAGVVGVVGPAELVPLGGGGCAWAGGRRGYCGVVGMEAWSPQNHHGAGCCCCRRATKVRTKSSSVALPELPVRKGKLE